MRWPAAWKEPSLVELLRDTPVNYVLTANGEPVPGLKATVSASAPDGVEVLKGSWPGTRMAAPGESDRVVAGPTGEPWIDSNGWRIALASAQHPGKEVWVEAIPVEPRLYPESYVAGLADAAANGGRWMIQLDDKLVAGIAGGNAAATATWKRLMAAAKFFADWRWQQMQPLALVGVVSRFAGEGAPFSQEVLNLLARANQQYRVILTGEVNTAALAGLRAAIYVDQVAPAPALRTALTDFAERGGLLIAGPAWGAGTGPSEAHPRYDVRAFGKGLLAVARKVENDPYLMVQDAMVLVSHRYDLLRFWNGGAVRACLAASPDRKRGLLQMVFYANARAGDATVRVVGNYRSARLFSLDGTEQNVKVVPEKDAVELHLPAVAQYAAVQLDA
jgi:hypothetical protein